ncbi:DUF11 domain-containing protein [Paraglaciecola sp. MB-3u-78]|uniref:DUF11 domain-containing protein n=1 Tax=Paraglaciecola sp. MB-3u-78 TaxID=2058332 RepID=UPI000C32C0BF|nr:DUF11 domain-containing protein [Paraglaciecola sp. MB-3u-78]PKG95630.1 hypothetical protein CXF95_25845 [Paraglaciecola sp. MB-3u-78]
MSASYLVLFLAAIFSFHTSALTINITSDSDTKAASAPKVYKIYVSNTDKVTRNNVQLRANVPSQMTFYRDLSLPTVNVCSSTCSTGQVPRWDLGDIAAGQTKIIHALYFTKSNASDEDVTISTSVSYDGISSSIDTEQGFSFSNDVSCVI